MHALVINSTVGCIITLIKLTTVLDRPSLNLCVELMAMHSFVPIASTQHMVGGVGLLLTMYLQCTAVIVHGLYIKFECFWTNNRWVFS